MSGKLPKGFSELRIIGGKFRSRKIIFPEIVGCRPTPNRVRETLFNWLTPYIHQSNCLDLFAGSGALGFEALSRGANYCLMLDSSPQVIASLQKNKEELHLSTTLDIFQATFPYSFQTCRRFNIVFIDPPFNQGYVDNVLDWLQQSDYLDNQAIIYIEAEPAAGAYTPPLHWLRLKDKTAGNVHYSLFQLIK